MTDFEQKLQIPRDLALKAGRQIWRNETGGQAEAITAWNNGEEFASMGIGHFIWYPAGRRDQFAESFPEMISFVRSRGAKLPAWLDKRPIPPCPWNSKAEFMRAFKSAEMVELRRFLQATFAEQTQFMAQRMRQALPKMLATLSTQREKDHVKQQFLRVAASSKSLYPLLDYVNFKGEGISPSETFLDARSGRRVGWGLKDALLQMSGAAQGQSALDDFSKATKAVLLRRIANNPPSRRWQEGWMKRCDTYRRALA